MQIRKLCLVAGLTALAMPAFAQSSHSVRGYTRKDGTYVAPHMQTNPNSTKLDNWSTRGNVNPYTGREGTVDPYKSQSPSSTRSPYSPYSPGSTSTRNQY